MTLGQELAQIATTTNERICEDWHKKLNIIGNDVKHLIELYIKGIDFCFKNDFPSKKYIRENFKGKMEVYGVFLDDTIAIDNQKNVVLLGDCIASLTYTDFNVCQLFIRDNSVANVVVKDNSILVIDIFYNSKLNIVCNDNCKVIINNFEGEINIEKSETATIKLIDKGKRGY